MDLEKFESSSASGWFGNRQHKLSVRYHLITINVEKSKIGIILKKLLFPLILLVQFNSSLAQENDITASNMMAITSANDSIFFYVADSVKVIKLPPRSIRLFTTSKQLIENLSPNYPGIKYMKIFSTRGNKSLFGATEASIERPFIKLILKTKANYKFNSYGGTSYKTYDFDFQIGESGKVIPESSASKQLEALLRTDPEAELQYEKYLSSKKWFWIGLSSTLVGGVGAIMNVSANNEGSSDPDKITIDLSTGKRKEEFKPFSGLSIGLLAVSVSGMIIMGVNYNTAPPHLVEAVSIYNRNLAKEKGVELPGQ